MNIKEAWAALNYVGPQKEEIAAARALALAVLDVAQTTWRSDPEEYMRLQDALRARIKALGN